MKRMRHAQVGIFVYAITASGLTLATCPPSMPEQLLEDCIVYQGAGSSFPTSDYAHMDQYQTWLKTRQVPARVRPTTAAAPKIK